MRLLSSIGKVNAKEILRTMKWFRTKDGYVNLELIYEVSRTNQKNGTLLYLRFGSVVGNARERLQIVIDDPNDVSRLETLLDRASGVTV